MPFQKGDTETARSGGKARAANHAERTKKIENLLVRLGGGFADGYTEKMEDLKNGKEITKPEKEFMDRFEKWPEFITPKLARNEITGKGGKDLIPDHTAQCKANDALKSFINGGGSKNIGAGDAS